MVYIEAGRRSRTYTEIGFQNKTVLKVGDSYSFSFPMWYISVKMTQECVSSETMMGIWGRGGC